MTYYSSELFTLSRYNIPYRLLQGLFPGNIPVVKFDTSPLRADGPLTEDEEAWRFTKAQRAAPARIRRWTGLANDMGFRTPLYPEPERPCELVLNWSPMLLSSTITPFHRQLSYPPQRGTRCWSSQTLASISH